MQQQNPVSEGMLDCSLLPTTVRLVHSPGVASLDQLDDTGPRLRVYEYLPAEEAGAHIRIPPSCAC